jgi:hypothetical protein
MTGAGDQLAKAWIAATSAAMTVRVGVRLPPFPVIAALVARIHGGAMTASGSSALSSSSIDNLNVLYLNNSFH